MFFNIRVDDHCLSIFIGPEFMEFDEYGDHCFALSTFNNVFQCNFGWIPWFDHVENFVFHIIKVDWFSTMRLNLLLNALRKKSGEYFSIELVLLIESYLEKVVQCE